MKKLFVLLLLTISLTACGGGAATGGSSAPAAQSSTADGSTGAPEASGEEADAAAEEAQDGSEEAAASDPAQSGDTAPEQGGEGSADIAAEAEDNKDSSSGLALSDVYLKIQSLVELKSPVEMPETFLENTYGVDPSILEDKLIVISEDATSAETIAVLKVKDPGDLESAVSALAVIVEEKSQEMQNYLPEQYEIVKKSKVQTSGNCAYLVISENASDIIGIIEEHVK